MFVDISLDINLNRKASINQRSHSVPACFCFSTHPPRRKESAKSQLTANRCYHSYWSEVRSLIRISTTVAKLLKYINKLRRGLCIYAKADYCELNKNDIEYPSYHSY